MGRVGDSLCFRGGSVLGVPSVGFLLFVVVCLLCLVNRENRRASECSVVFFLFFAPHLLRPCGQAYPYLTRGMKNPP